MFKNISNLGKVISKTEQKTINGGFGEPLGCSAQDTYYNGECWSCTDYCEG